MISWHAFPTRPQPFWFLNHELELDEIVRQVCMMHAKGVGGLSTMRGMDCAMPLCHPSGWRRSLWVAPPKRATRTLWPTPGWGRFLPA